MNLTGTEYTNINDFLPSSDKNRQQKVSAESSSELLDMAKFNDLLEAQGVDGIKINKEAATSSKHMNQPDFVKNMCYTTEEFFRTFGPKQHYQGKWCSMAELIDLWKMGRLKLEFSDEDLQEMGKQRSKQ